MEFAEDLGFPEDFLGVDSALVSKETILSRPSAPDDLFLSSVGKSHQFCILKQNTCTDTDFQEVGMWIQAIKFRQFKQITHIDKQRQENGVWFKDVKFTHSKRLDA